MTDALAPGFARLGHACLVAGALGWAWAFLAFQAPSSPWHAPGFPLAVPNATGAFLVKDVLLLLGAALWSAGEALRSIHRPKATATPA